MADRNGYPMKLDMSFPAIFRAIFVGAGLFALGISTWELWHGVWPLNAFSPFVGLILAGAWALGGTAVLAGMTAWASSWTIENGRIEIRNRNPLTSRQHILTLSDVDRFDIVEREPMEGANTWHVSVITTAGRKFDTYDMPNKQAAEKLRDEILKAFRG